MQLLLAVGQMADSGRLIRCKSGTNSKVWMEEKSSGMIIGSCGGCPVFTGRTVKIGFFVCIRVIPEHEKHSGTHKRRLIMAEMAAENKKMNNSAGSRNKAKGAVNVRYITVTGVLSAAAFALQYIEIPALFMPSFIKFDLSDLPALIGAFAMGPVCGVLIELIKNLLHCAVSQSFGVGELSNFILGAIFAGVAGAIYKSHKTKKGALVASLIGAIAMAVLSFPSNLFVVYPVYYQFMPEEVILQAYQAIIPGMKSVAQSLLVFNVPFTFVKGMIDVLITFLIYKKISPILKGDH